MMKLRKKILKMLAKGCPGNRIRLWLLRRCCYHIGKDVYIGEDLIIIDDLTEHCTNLIIGDRVSIAPRVALILHSQPNLSRIADHVGSRKGQIVIEDDAWIGIGAVVLPGLRIGRGAVVGANAVVTKDVEAYTMVGGVPAKKINTVNMPERSKVVEEGTG